MLCCTPLILQKKHLPVGCTSSLVFVFPVSIYYGNVNVDRNLKTLWMEVNHTHLQSSSPNTQHLYFMIQPLIHPCSLPAWTPLLHLASLPSSMCSD